MWPRRRASGTVGAGYPFAAPAPSPPAVSAEQLDARLDLFAERFERVAIDAVAVEHARGGLPRGEL